MRAPTSTEKSRPFSVKWYNLRQQKPAAEAMEVVYQDRLLAELATLTCENLS